jgi:hypothetical protein
METDGALSKAAAQFARSARAFSSRGSADDDVIPELADILILLAQQPEWRVFVDGTRNFGHQSSTVTTLRRLIDLTGFSGRVVVVYADHGRPWLGCTAEKLALMFPGVDPRYLSDCVAFYGTCRNIYFLPFEHRAEMREMVTFGFTGGADEMSVNYALELNVRFFARVQPYLWDDPPSNKTDPYYESSRIEQPDGRHLYLLEAYPEFQYLAIRPALQHLARIDPAVWRWYSTEQNFDAGLAYRTHNINTILTACSRESEGVPAFYCLWPLYGLQHFKDQVAEIFFVCVLAALHYHRNAQGSVVLCSFSPHEELDGWAELIDALACDLAVGGTNLQTLKTTIACRYSHQFSEGLFSSDHLDAWIKTISAWVFSKGEITNPKVFVHRAYDAVTGKWTNISSHLDSILKTEIAPGVHIIEVGLVPMDIFHYCMSRGDLPSVIEGQATANLLTSLGRPFLQILREEHVLKNGYATCEREQEFGRMAEEIGSMGTSIRHLLLERWLLSTSTAHPSDYCADIDRIRVFLEMASDPTTDVARYFASVGRHFSQNVYDKLFISLLALREVVLSDA